VEPELEHQLLAFEHDVVTDTGDVELLLIALGHALDHVGDERASRALQSPRRTILADGRHLESGTVEREVDLGPDGELELALLTLHDDASRRDQNGHALRHHDWFLADPGHLNPPCRGLRRRRGAGGTRDPRARPGSWKRPRCRDHPEPSGGPSSRDSDGSLAC